MTTWPVWIDKIHLKHLLQNFVVWFLIFFKIIILPSKFYFSKYAYPSAALTLIFACEQDAEGTVCCKKCLSQTMPRQTFIMTVFFAKTRLFCPHGSWRANWKPSVLIGFWVFEIDPHTALSLERHPHHSWQQLGTVCIQTVRMSTWAMLALAAVFRIQWITLSWLKLIYHCKWL